MIEQNGDDAAEIALKRAELKLSAVIANRPGMARHRRRDRFHGIDSANHFATTTAISPERRPASNFRRAA
jgi:hypothetical protein